MNKEIKTSGVAETAAILTAVVKLLGYLSSAWKAFKKYREKKNQERIYKEAEKALRRKDVKTINDILNK